MRAFFTAALIGATCLAPAANANPTGWDDFMAGRYDQAIDKARRGSSADDFSLACKAGLTAAGYLDTGPGAVERLHSAIGDCERALRLDPDHLEAGLSLALGAGFEGKRTGSAALAKRARQLIENLVLKHPENPMPAAALGGWHGAVSYAGLLARTFLGASKKKAISWFDHSRRLGAWTVPLRFEYIKFLARGNARSRAHAIEQIDILLLTPAPLAVDQLLQNRARQLLSVLRDGRKRAIKRTVIGLSAFPGITDQKDMPAYLFDESLWPSDEALADTKEGLRVENLSPHSKQTGDR